jgi:hypothetical protein
MTAPTFHGIGILETRRKEIGNYYRKKEKRSSEAKSNDNHQKYVFLMFDDDFFLKARSKTGN